MSFINYLHEMRDAGRYEVEKEGQVYLVYDKEKDVYVDRFGNVYTEGFLTKQEAQETVKFLNAKL